jgi:hypothetical protein
MDESIWSDDRKHSKITEMHPDPKIFPDYYKTKRLEFILRPGEMIFIPSGWFHFVFSEDPDPETGLCAAINFWYEADTQISVHKPKFGWHSINFEKVIDDIKTYPLLVHKSSMNFFPPAQLKFRYPGIDLLYMTFDQFYEAKNHEHYILQQNFEKLNDYRIPFESPIKKSSIWINWGHCNSIPHYDGLENWLCQLKGKRRVILIPPSDSHLMYTFNPYPNDLLDKICYQYTIGEKLLHFKQYSICKNVVQELLEALGNNDQILVECTDLSNSFEKELYIHNSLLKQNESTMIPYTLQCKVFEIKKYYEGDNITIDCQLGTLWFLSKGKVKVRKSIVNVNPGNGISFPGNNWLYPLKVESECIIIRGHGFSDGAS